jgi:penicillin-binding protein 1A
MRLKLGALGPRLRSGALIYVVSLAAALGEGLMAAASVSSRVFNVPRWDPPPLAAPPVTPRATRPAILAATAPPARPQAAGVPLARKTGAVANGRGRVEVRPTIMPVAPSVAHRVVAGVRRELEQAREAQAPRPTHARVRRDSRGRRLRASAYIYGPNASRSTRGRYHGRLTGLLGAALPATAKIMLVLLAAGVAFLGSSQAYINYAADLPDAHSITSNPLPEDSLIYAADGTLLADVHPSGIHHYFEPLEKMGTYLPEATIAIEDANFWNEPGIDPGAMARAAWVDWREKKPVQGASTITQQLVKLRLIGNQPSIDRKIKEAILAIQVEHTYSKRQILEQYLNTIAYSNNAQGSLAASRIYFHKDTKDLTLGEASMLAGIPQSPFYNSPFLHWDNAKQRQHDVLAAMVKQKMITQDDADTAFAEDLTPPNHMFTAHDEVQAPAFTSWVVKQLQASYGEQAAVGGGLRVVTTLNMGLQKIAQDAVVANVNANRGKNLTQGAMVSIDPRTGAVLTMVGSANPDANGGQYNMAVWPPRNPGSSMKIYNYTAGIESGKFTMNTPIADSPLTINVGESKPYQPKNYDGKYHGTCTFQQCMGNSLNVPAVKVEISIGVDKVVDAARRMGAPPWNGNHEDGSYTSNDPATSFGPSLTLGGYGETPLQMATGAAVLGAQGVLHPPFGIASVKDSAGNEIFKADPVKSAKQVVDPKVAFIMEQIMSDNDNRQLVFGSLSANLLLNGRRAGAKTGTTENWGDAWTVGYTPSLASAFWFGNPDNTPLATGADAIYVAAPAWKSYMQSALAAMQAPPAEWYGEPPGLGHALANGKLIYLMPGTSASQPAPPLPSNARSSAATCSPSPKPGSDPNANKACAGR